jgi:hypothetical protein
MTDSFKEYSVVVYGGTLAGVSALRAFRQVDPDRSVLFINPQPGWAGQAGTSRQNSWDLRDWHSADGGLTPQGGSFRAWYEATGLGYEPASFEELVAETVRDDERTDLVDYWDIVSLSCDSDGPIDRVEVAPLKRAGGETRESGQSVVIDGDIFVDASVSGRLTRLAGVPHTIGRDDWYGDDRQMAATLMFAMQDIDHRTVEQTRSPNGQQTYGTTTDATGSHRLFWGGHWYARNADAVQAFNDNYPRFRLKALNATEGRNGVFWFNALLVYDVDARYDARDAGKILAHDHRPWHRDQARSRAVEAISDDRFLRAVRSFPGLEQATLVYEDGDPLTAESLYVRESIHMTRNGEHALGDHHVREAGSEPTDGADAELYSSRIGLGYYWMNSNGYETSEPSDSAAFHATENPVYLPYEMLTPVLCPNLLVPGYATSASSKAWFELRVGPNQCVLGDAAGIAAAVANRTDTDPSEFTDEEIKQVQRHLHEEVDAILEKRTSYGAVAR